MSEKKVAPTTAGPFEIFEAIVFSGGLSKDNEAKIGDLLMRMHALKERVAALESALREASTMPMHWSSRKKQKQFRELLGDAAPGKVKA